MLQVDHLTIKRQGRSVIKDLSFKLDQGDVLCVIGPNGVGKSTLIKCLSGIIPNDKGSITYNGFNVYQHIEEYQELLSYQPDVPVVDSELTIYQNLMLWAALSGREMTVDAVLHTMQLMPQAYEKAGILSRGQLQRLHLAKLLVTDSDLWLLDEPSVHLDDYWVQYLQQMIGMKTSHGGMVVYTSHQVLKLEGQRVLELRLT